MAKLKKSASFTDIHWGKKSNSEQHNEDCLNFIKFFCKKVKTDTEIDHIVFLGDWFDQRSSINISTLNYAYEGAKLLDDLGLPVYFIVGNHDLYHRHSRNVYSVRPFDQFDNFIVVNELMVVNEIEGGVLFSPYLFHHEYEDLQKYLTVPIWYGHFEFKGFVITGYNIAMPTGPDHEHFKGPAHIFSGHFHKRQAVDNICYIGNAFPMDFGDAGDFNRGMMIYDYLKDEVIFENWDECPTYAKTTLSKLLAKKTNKSEILRAEARILCIVDIPITFEESTYLKQKFKEDYNLREFVMEESPELRTAISDTETDVEWDENEIASVGELVLKMLNDIESEHIDNNLLIEIYKNLK